MDINNDPVGAGQATPPPPQPPVPPLTPAPGPTGPNGHHPNTGMAIIAYLGILVLIPLLTEAKNDPFVKFHIKQGLLVLIGLVLSSIIVVVPVLGWAIGSLIWIASIILMIIGIMNAANGKQEELPLVGHLSRNFHF
jgi:uncharacterized membrane protein